MIASDTYFVICFDKDKCLLSSKVAYLNCDLPSLYERLQPKLSV